MTMDKYLLHDSLREAEALLASTECLALSPQPHTNAAVAAAPQIEATMEAARLALREAALRVPAEVAEALTPGHAATYPVRFVQVWRTHMVDCLDADAGLASLPDASTPMTRAQLKDLWNLLERLHESDIQKRRTSAECKGVLEYLLAEQPDINAEKMTWALTPTDEPFFCRYPRETLDDPGTALQMYHRDVQALLELRLATDPALQRRRPPRPWGGASKWQHLPATPILETVDLLLTLDNLWEYVWAKRMVGLPDWLARTRFSVEAHRTLGSAPNPLSWTELTQSAHELQVQ
jgi:hypothetical protein